MASASYEFKNILVIHFGQLGDVVLGLPAFRAIRERFADARITALTGKVAGEIVRLSGFVDDVVIVDRVELRDGPKLRSIAKVLRLMREMRRREFDLIIDLHSLKETNILAWLSGAKHSLLAHRGNRSYHRLGNFDPPPPAEDRSLPLSETYLRVLSPLGVGAKPEPVIFSPVDEVGAHLRERLLTSIARPIVGLFPGAGHPSRCWPLERFVELAAKLAANGYGPAVFIGPEERSIRDEIVSAFPAGTPIVEDLSIAEFIAAAAELSIFVTNDTGPMHLAALAGTPIVLVIDARAPLTYLPLADRLEVVNSAKIEQIPVAVAYAAARKLLDPGSK